MSPRTPLSVPALPPARQAARAAIAVNDLRRQRKNLAAVIREKVDPELVTEWLMTVWLEGRMPPPPRRAGAAYDRSDPDALDGFMPCTPEFRYKCLEMLLLRGFGQPTTHVVLDAEVRALVQVDHAQARDRLLALDPHRRAALRELLSQVAGRPGAPAIAPGPPGMPRTIDVPAEPERGPAIQVLGDDDAVPERIDGW